MLFNRLGVCFLVLAAAALSACDGGGAPDAGVSGSAAYAANCASCHGAKAAGSLGPNITFSVSAGIGSLTLDQFSAAVRTGVRPAAGGTDGGSGGGADGGVLCDQMTRYTKAALSDATLESIYSYLQTLKDDTKNKGSYCP